jgi:hypothetical protein
MGPIGTCSGMTAGEVVLCSVSAPIAEPRVLTLGGMAVGVDGKFGNAPQGRAWAGCMCL